MIFFDYEQVIKLHSTLISKTGGIDGVRDDNRLDSALKTPFRTFGGKDRYPEILDKASQLCYSLIENHPFTDGNKRIYQYNELYRIFYYDCEPLKKTIYNPLTQKNFDFSKSTTYVWMNTFLNSLKQRRKIALRMGFFADEEMNYIFSSDTVKKLCKGALKVEDLSESDLILNMRQKGVDMKIGLDIASLAYKKLVDQIVLISGDSDFVPAAKLARVEGIDFIVDSMGMKINENLVEHIDGLRSYYKKINNQKDEN